MENLEIYKETYLQKQKLFEEYDYDIQIKKSKMFDFKNSTKDKKVNKTVFSVKIVKGNSHISLSTNDLESNNLSTEIDVINAAIQYCYENLIKI